MHKLSFRHPLLAGRLFSFLTLSALALVVLGCFTVTSGAQTAERRTDPLRHDHSARFREIASFQSFGGSAGTRVATTSTTTGANLLVSGVDGAGTDASVLKYEFVRPDGASTTLQAVRLGQVWSGKGSMPANLGGD